MAQAKQPQGAAAEAAALKDADIRDMHELIDKMAHDPVYSYGKDPKVNNLYFSVSDFYHTDYLVPYYLWNSLTVLFQGME